MGKISNMQQKQNNENGVNLSYARNQAKPRLKIKGIKDLVTLLGPNGSKYKLSKNQRNFQLKGRITIAAIASALAIAGTTAYAVNQSQSAPVPVTETNISEMSELTKEGVLESAEDALLDFIYQNSSSDLKNRAIIKYKHNEKLNLDTFIVYDRYQNPNSDPSVRFSYNKHNDTIDKIVSKSSKNNSEVDKLLDSMIEVYLNKSPSEKDLQGLSDKVSNLDFSQLKFDGKNIVDKSQEKDINNER